MKKETLTLLGLGENATDQEVHDKVLALTNKAKQVEQLELAAVTSAVNTAIAEKRITEAQRDHFMKLGKHIGDKYEILSGVNPGDDVVIAGRSRLANGKEVEIVK